MRSFLPYGRLAVRLGLILLIAAASGLWLHAQDLNPAGREFPAVQLPAPARGAAALGALVARFPELSEWYGKSPDEMRSIFLHDRTAWADRGGRLHYVCEQDPPPPEEFAAQDGMLLAEAAVPYDQTFTLHSRPGARKVIYLDFNGHTTTGTPWNGSYGDPIVSAPFDLDGIPSSWSTTELDRIQYIWQRVAEDYSMYDVDVTTQDPGIEGLRKTSSTDVYYGQRVVISPTNWYKTSAGGVAYVGSFNWSTDTPCFVFAAQLSNSEKYLAEAASHESGHTLGLNHDGTTAGVTYYAGHGNWAPIMGVGYSKSVVQWSKGEYTSANNTEDDLAIMTGYGFGLRADDHGNYIDNATLLTGTSLSASGIVERRTDTDVFRFNCGAGQVTISVKAATPSPNLDIQASLYNGTGVLLATNNASTTMDASLSLSVAAGTYYLQIDGVGTGDPTTGYSDYASLGQYTISGTVPAAGANRPPTASATATPASGTAPLAVTFSSAGSSDPDGTIASYSWSFGDGGTATGATVSHTYTTAGTFTATLVVTDNGGLTGNATVTVTVSQAANKAPIAIASATPTSGSAPLAVNFSGSGSHDLDGSISSYSWSFGDGGTATGLTASHTYSTAGTYTARLTVTDNRGATGSATVTITVTQPKVVRVRSIVLSVVNDAGNAVVTITDLSNVLRPGATVTGMWSGIITGSVTGTTGTNGTVTLASVSTRRRGTITLTVTGVTASGYVYNAAQNLQTSASVTKTK